QARAEVTSGADLVGGSVGADAAVARRQLRVQLGVLVAEDDVVERNESARSVRLGIRNLVLRTCVPGPEVILPYRTADFHAEVTDVVDRVGRAEIGRRFGGNRGVRLIAARGVEVTARAA